MADRNVGIALVLSATDRASAKINAIVTNAVSKLDKVQKRTSQMADASFTAGRQLIAGGIAMGGPIAYATKKAMDFEEAMAGVAKVTNTLVGSSEFKYLSSQASDLAKYLAIGNTEAALMMQSLAQGGVAKQELKTVGILAGQAAVAFDMGADIAGDRFVKMKNAMNMTIAATKEAFDSINFLSDRSAAEASQLLEFMAAGGAGVARTLSLSAQQMQAFGTVLIEQGKGPEETATIFERLQKGIYKNAAAFAIYSKAGKGAAGINAILQKGMGIKDEVARNAYFRKIGGEYSTDIMQLARSNDKLQEYLGLVANKQNYLNSVQGEFNNKSNTSNFKLRQAMANFEAFAIIIGNNVLPHLNKFLEKITPLIQRFSTWAEKNKPLVTTILKIVGSLAALSITTGVLSFLFGGVSRSFSFATGTFKNGAKVVKWLTDSKKGLGHWLFVLRYRFMTFSQFITTKALPALIRVGTFLRSGLVKALGVVMRSIGMISRVLMANPIILIITGIAVAAYLIYRNWDKIKAWFTRLWGSVKKIFSATWDWIKNMFLNYTPVGLIFKHWDSITGYFGNLWDKVKNVFTSTWEWLKGLSGKFWDAGKNIIESVWKGMKAMINKPVEAMKEMVQKLRDHLPFSPAKVGPLKDIHRIKLIETIAGTIKPNALVKAWGSSLATLNNTMKRPVPVPAVAGRGSFSFNPTIHISGTATQQDANMMSNEIKRLFKQFMIDYERNQKRVSYE